MYLRCFIASWLWHSVYIAAGHDASKGLDATSINDPAKMEASMGMHIVQAKANLDSRYSDWEGCP